MTAPNIQVPTKPTERGASTTISQRDRRWTDTFFDDYRHARFPNGRPFTGEREFKSGVSEQSLTAGFLQSDLSCGEFFCENPAMGQTPEERQRTLASAWVAPWLPPGGKKYMHFNYAKSRITWRFDAFINDERNALERFWEACAVAAGQGEVVDPERPDALAFRLRKVFGSPRTYLNKIRLAQACQAGDPWIMGAVDTPNEELAKLLGFQPIRYMGGAQMGDAAYVTVPAQKAPEPLVTPDQALAAPDINALIAAAIEAHEAKKKADHKAKVDAGIERAKKAKLAKLAAKKPTEVGAGG